MELGWGHVQEGRGASVADVASRKSNARKTDSFVKTPALCVSALTPNASKAVRKTSTVVQPCYNENGRCTQTGKANSSQQKHKLCREMTRTFVIDAFASMVLLNYVVDVRDSQADEQHEDESNDIVLLALWACAASSADPAQAHPMYPDTDVDGVENGQEQEAPTNAVADYPLSCIKDLIDNSSKKKQVDNRPLRARNNQQVDTMVGQEGELAR